MTNNEEVNQTYELNQSDKRKKIKNKPLLSRNVLIIGLVILCIIIFLRINGTDPEISTKPFM